MLLACVYTRSYALIMRWCVPVSGVPWYMDTKKADKYPLNAYFRAFCGTLYAVAHILLIREIRASRASLFEQPSDGRFACLMSGVVQRPE